MSKATNKSGSRITALIEQLERLVAAEKSGVTRDVEQLRYVTFKMYQLLQTQEKGKKETLNKILEKTTMLLGLLEGCNDSQLTLNVLECLSELSAGGKKAIATLVGQSTIDILLRMLKVVAPDQTLLEDSVVLIHSILAKIGPKDRKFALKTRLTGSLQFTVDVIRQNCNNFKVLHPALLVIKLSAGSSVNCSVLNKAGFVSILFRILPNCGHKRVTTLKLVLNLLATFVKSKSVAVKAVNLNGVEILLRMFCDWHRTDHHNRHTGVRKTLLNSLKALVATKVGKTAFLQSDGMKILFVFCSDTTDCKELDSINNNIVQVLRLCMPDSFIPLTNPQARVTFQLPKNVIQVKPGACNVPEAMERDSDEDESTPSESEEEDGRITESQDDSEATGETASCSVGTESRNDGRSKEDLVAMYDKFFPEINLCKETVEEFGDVTPEVQRSIVIPTGSMEFSCPGLGSSDLPCEVDNAGESDCPCENSKDYTKNNCTNELRLSDSDKPPKVIALETPEGVTSNTTNQERDKTKTITAKTSDVLYEGICDRTFKVRSVSQFIGVPAADIYGHCPPLHPEPLNTKKPGIQRSMLLKDVERVLQGQKVINKVVYDLDCAHEPNKDSTLELRDNSKECFSAQLSSCTSSCDSKAQSSSEKSLVFESKFECGNLRKAIQIYEREYDLILNSDVNCTGHHQWFYFEVSNMEENVPYKFNIINCEKVNSQFNFGMQPVLYSCKDAEDGDPGWIRTGTDICYYKNHYKRPSSNSKSERDRFFYSVTFTVQFPYSNDRCYLAYHYPYSFSLLENHCLSYEYRLDSTKIFYKRQILCNTLTGNPCYLVTITSPTSSNDNRAYIFLCSRVHPGESNSSWVMKGVLDFLLSNKITARLLREIFIFKIIPMLNPDGVINGCHRCSLSGADLNRQWVDPDCVLYPTIYHAKGLLLYLQALNKKPLVFCDFHGHSRKKNVFMYGCPSIDIPVTIAGSETDPSNGGEAIKETNHRTLPRVLHSIAPAFSLQNCSFNVEPSKESTARVVVWRELGVARSYTMENSYCGTDQGPYKGFHLGTKELEEMGRCFCTGLLKLGNSSSITRLLGSIPKSTLDERSANEDFLLSNSDLFAPVDTFPYEGQDYATQLLV